MNKFMTGMITGAVVGTATSIIVTNTTNSKKMHPKKTFRKTLHNLGDMADNIIR